MLQDIVDKAVNELIQDPSYGSFTERQALADIYGEVTFDTGFKGWKYFPKDSEIRAIMCMMELRSAIHRRLPVEHKKNNHKAIEMLKTAELSVNRVIIDARRQKNMTEDNVLDMYLDIITK